YVWKTIVPLDLSPFYPLQRPVLPLGAPYLLGGAVVVVITGFVILARRRWPAAGAVWLVYVVTLLPVSGVFQNGPQISADRYSYLPSLSLALITGAAGLGAWRVWTGRRHGRAPGFCLTGAGVVLVTALTLLTWQQIEIWHDSERLWTHAVSLTPSWMAHLQLGNVRRQQARLAEANEHYRQASSMRPDAPDVLIQWGVALGQRAVRRGRSRRRDRSLPRSRASRSRRRRDLQQLGYGARPTGQMGGGDPQISGGARPAAQLSPRVRQPGSCGFGGCESADALRPRVRPGISGGAGRGP